MLVKFSNLRFLQFAYINENARDGGGTESFSVVVLQTSAWKRAVWSGFVTVAWKKTESRCLPSDKHRYASFWRWGWYGPNPHLRTRTLIFQLNSAWRICWEGWQLKKRWLNWCKVHSERIELNWARNMLNWPRRYHKLDESDHRRIQLERSCSQHGGKSGVILW